MSDRTPDLSVIIVNWNSCVYLRNCLASIRAESRDVSFEVIVLDNASFDGADRLVNDEFPGATFIQLQENTGFARANNIGAAAAKGRLLCFLNPDTEFRSNVFLPVREAMDAAGGSIGAAGCRLLNSDLSLQTSCVMPFPTITNQLFDIEWLKMKTPRWRFWGIRALFDENRGGTAEVDALSGACMFIRPEVFRSVGGFTEEYFMYSEDVDLCWKIRTAGFSVVYLPFVEIVHHGGGSTRDKTPGLFSTVMMREALFRYFIRNRNRGYAYLYRCSMFTVALTRITAAIIASPLLLMRGRRLTLAAVLKKWWYVLGWSAGCMRVGMGRQP